MSYRLQILHENSYGLSDQLTKYKSTKKNTKPLPRTYEFDRFAVQLILNNFNVGIIGITSVDLCITMHSALWRS